MLAADRDWMEFGSANEQRDAHGGPVKTRVRSPYSPLGEWYGQKKCPRRRFGMFVPPLMEHQRLADPKHNAPWKLYPLDSRNRDDEGDLTGLGTQLERFLHV